MKRKYLAVWSRKLHRWGTLLVLLPLFVMIVTGILLQWKKNADWIQPPAREGARPGQAPAVSFDEILAAARSAEQAGIRSWEDVDRLDVRPDKGILKVHARESDWEVQVDLATGEVLQVALRRSDMIEALHDGSWFHEGAKLWVFFPAAVVLLVLYLTGLYLFYLPYKAKWSRSGRDRTARRRKTRPVLPPVPVEEETP